MKLPKMRTEILDSSTREGNSDGDDYEKYIGTESLGCFKLGEMVFLGGSHKLTRLGRKGEKQPPRRPRKLKKPSVLK